MTSLAGLDMNLLLVLDALLEERNVTRAARRVGLSQPAVSNALARLRIALGNPLFVRSGRGIAPTARALALAPPLRRALDDLDNAVAAFAGFDAASARRLLRLVCSDHIELVLVPPLLARLAERAPFIDVEVRRMGLDDDPKTLLTRQSIDFAALRAGNDVSAGVHAVPLLEERYVSVVRNGHPMLKDAPIDVVDLDTFSAWPHLLVSPRGGGALGVVDQLLAERGRKRRIALTTPHFSFAAMVVAESDLVVTLAERVARNYARFLPLTLFQPPVPIEPFRVDLMWHERHEHDAGHRWLKNEIIAVAAAI